VKSKIEKARTRQVWWQMEMVGVSLDGCPAKKSMAKPSIRDKVPTSKGWKFELNVCTHAESRGGRRARWVRKMLHRDVGIWRQQSLVACVRLAPGRPPSYSSGCGTGRARRRSCPLAAPGRSNSTAWTPALRFARRS
jgi:hypothetical protein